MNSLIVFEHEVNKNIITIDDQTRAGHLHDIIKAKPGQKLKATIVNQGLTQLELSQLSKNKVKLTICDELKPVQHPSWHLVVGLSRPPTMKKILEHGASLGVNHFHFFPAALSEKSYADSKIWSDGKAEQCLYDGLSQSAYFWKKPIINIYKDMTQLPDFTGFDKRLLSLSSESTDSMSKIDSKQELVMAFGPERGWTQAEDKLLQSRGYKAVKLSPTVLRVEIAVFATLGQAHLLLE